MNITLKTMIDNMPVKTGKSLEGWIDVLKEKRFAKHGEAVNYLKSEHNLTHGYANTIVHLFKENPLKKPDLVSQQYQGKETLKPIYDRLKEEISSFGGDVAFAPKKAYVSVRRKKQFALIQPSTKTRVDVGLNLKGKDPTDELENAGSWNTMCSHRIRLSSLDAITPKVIGWLREAYENAG